MFFKKKSILLISSFFIFSISFIYGYIVGEGLYGFSNDYYEEYFKSNLIYPSIREKLGSLLSTLTINNFHIGVHLTSFFLAVSSGVILQAFLFAKNIRSILFFIFIFFITLHIHPIIMSTSGAMRQGWTMCFIFLSFAMILYNKKSISFLFIIIAIFLHKSGLFYFMIYCYTVINFFLLRFLKNKKIIIFINGFFLFISSSYGLYVTGWSLTEHRVVAGDFRLIWLIANITFIFFYLFLFDINLSDELKFLRLYIFFHCCAAPSFYLMGLNWQYERINMVIALPLILVVGSHFNKKSSYLYLTVVLCMYLFLTIYQGMYTVGLT